MQQIFKQVPEALPCGAGAGPRLYNPDVFSNKYAAPGRLLPTISSKKECCLKDSSA